LSRPIVVPRAKERKQFFFLQKSTKKLFAVRQRNILLFCTLRARAGKLRLAVSLSHPAAKAICEPALVAPALVAMAMAP
jgi:hypothetical protein